MRFTRLFKHIFAPELAKRYIPKNSGASGNGVVKPVFDVPTHSKVNAVALGE
jgi:hypothetical protein